jgi:hypothetical protein
MKWRAEVRWSIEAVRKLHASLIRWVSVLTVLLPARLCSSLRALPRESLERGWSQVTSTKPYLPSRALAGLIGGSDALAHGMR